MLSGSKTSMRCAGMRNQQIQRYLMNVLTTLRDRYQNS
jgi:hypothetical protein